MELKPSEPRTRRAVLAAGLGAAAATAASALRGPALVSAGNGDVVTVGGNLTGTQFTRIVCTGNPAFVGQSDAFSGFAGSSGSGAGVSGDSTSGIGVAGFGATFGVDGRSANTNGVGVRGFASATSGSTVGVVGRVDSPDGISVLARNTAGGSALVVEGKARFRRSGKATIKAGNASKKVTLAGVAGSSMVLAVLAQNRAGRYVRAVVPASGSFTIYLNNTVSSDTKVSWFVLDPFA
jgi:hypothetical protein